MNKILFKYLIQNFFKSFLITITIFFCFGILLNLFEEIEFFKNIKTSAFTPLMLTSLIVPSLIIKILPFIIFISSMWYMLKLRNSKELLTLKVFGYSNFKIFFILAFSSFILGWFTLFFLNPITSSMTKYYEKTKSNYSKDIDHLILFNKNGLWIKEKMNLNERIISAAKPENNNLLDVVILHLNEDMVLKEKIIAKKANISKKNWKLFDVKIFNFESDLVQETKVKSYSIDSNYDYNMINNLFKNFDTLSFLEITTNYKNLIESGYNDVFLKQSLHTMLSLPFFLFLMTALATVLTLNALRESENSQFIIVGLISSVTIFYLKDLSLALGQTDKIPIILSIWSPIIILSFLIFIGVLQINEK